MHLRSVIGVHWHWSRRFAPRGMVDTGDHDCGRDAVSKFAYESCREQCAVGVPSRIDRAGLTHQCAIRVLIRVLANARSFLRGS